MQVGYVEVEVCGVFRIRGIYTTYTYYIRLYLSNFCQIHAKPQLQSYLHLHLYSIVTNDTFE